MRASLLSAAAFLPSTLAYWHLIGVSRDQRYLPPAIVMHQDQPFQPRLHSRRTPRCTELFLP